tara:strand:+ start:1280 stop:1651 length:372 start_codon:yes stop_codon:yes gene_type:complete
VPRKENFMAASVSSATALCSLAGNGGGRITMFDTVIVFAAADTGIDASTIIAAIPGTTGTIIGISDRGGSAFDENVGADGCVPYFDSDVGSTGGEIRFVNTVDGVKNTAIAGATFHLTITVQQ